MNSPNVTTVPLPPAKGRSIGRIRADQALGLRSRGPDAASKLGKIQSPQMGMIYRPLRGVAVQRYSCCSRLSNGSGQPSSRHGGKPRRVGLTVCASIESAITEIARSGYPETTSTDLACASEALGLFSVTPFPVRLQRMTSSRESVTACDGVTYRNSLDRRPRPPGRGVST